MWIRRATLLSLRVHLASPPAKALRAFARLPSLFTYPPLPVSAMSSRVGRRHWQACLSTSTWLDALPPRDLRYTTGMKLSRWARPPAQLIRRSTGPGGSFWAGQPGGLRPALATISSLRNYSMILITWRALISTCSPLMYGSNTLIISLCPNEVPRRTCALQGLFVSICLRGPTSATARLQGARFLPGGDALTHELQLRRTV